VATIGQLQRQDIEIRTAERRAVEGLAEHLRGAVHDLPDQSPLGPVFLREADLLERQAARKPTAGAGLAFEGLARDIWLGGACW
jgi:hypothetical protein